MQLLAKQRLLAATPEESIADLNLRLDGLLEEMRVAIDLKTAKRISLEMNHLRGEIKRAEQLAEKSKDTRSKHEQKLAELNKEVERYQGNVEYSLESFKKRETEYTKSLGGGNPGLSKIYKRGMDDYAKRYLIPWQKGLVRAQDRLAKALKEKA